MDPFTVVLCAVAVYGFLSLTAIDLLLAVIGLCILMPLVLPVWLWDVYLGWSAKKAIRASRRKQQVQEAQRLAERRRYETELDSRAREVARLYDLLQAGHKV